MAVDHQNVEEFNFTGRFKKWLDIQDHPVDYAEEKVKNCTLKAIDAIQINVPLLDELKYLATTVLDVLSFQTMGFN
jgi:hypothetical protein